MRSTIVAVMALAACPGVALADPCEPHKAKYGSSHPLTVAGALALHAREGTPTDTDMRCLEQLWTPKDGTMAASATRALLLVVSGHPAVAIEAAAQRPAIYREWLADAARYGLHDVNGEAKLLRASITQLLTAKPRDTKQEQARKLLLEGLGAIQPFRF